MNWHMGVEKSEKTEKMSFHNSCWTCAENLLGLAPNGIVINMDLSVHCRPSPMRTGNAFACVFCVIRTTQQLRMFWTWILQILANY